MDGGQPRLSIMRARPSSATAAPHPGSSEISNQSVLALGAGAAAYNARSESPQEQCSELHWNESHAQMLFTCGRGVGSILALLTRKPAVTRRSSSSTIRSPATPETVHAEEGRDAIRICKAFSSRENSAAETLVREFVNVLLAE